MILHDRIFIAWLVAICAALYLLAVLLLRVNRSKRGFARAAGGLLFALLATFGGWRLLFYPGGEYHNPGLGGAYLRLALCPALLVLTAAAVSLLNYFLYRKEKFE